MKYLILETATQACSVCLCEETVILASRFDLKPRQHNQLILLYVQEVLEETQLQLSDLDFIAVSIGPGSFVGLRIGVGVAQGLAFANNLPVVPLSTLGCLAQTAYQQQRVEQVLVVLDAHMKEVYLGAYSLDEGKLMVAQQLDQRLLPEQVDAPQGEWVGVGDGWQSYFNKLQQRLPVSKVLQELHPNAADFARLALVRYKENHWVAPVDLQPVYLGDDTTWR